MQPDYIPSHCTHTPAGCDDLCAGSLFFGSQRETSSDSTKDGSDDGE